jgi:nitrogen fixation protein FixH
MKRFLGVILLAILAFSTGCSGKTAEDPHSVLRAYSRALDEGRAEDAYRMLSEEARRGISLEAFRRMVKDNPEEVREIARALSRPTATPVVTATVTSSTGQELQLVLENGKWKVEATAIDLYAQDTPRHAIQGFVRAVERKRYDVVLKYVPDSHKEGLDAAKLKGAWEGHDKEEIEQVVAGVKQALPSATIEETGDRATMAYSQGTMQLVRERGLWKIEDFD